jgi:hypothetical protein
MPFIGERSIIKPPSQTALPVTLWPPPDGDEQALRARELDGADDVAGTGAARDEPRLAVDGPFQT